ncbi:MAG: hypothetical protein HKN21_02475, partial [Candidatus Eisenbacteria bacterium]|nr:hypothetical protein [Candidatus Eisenbacteria bacterium]
MSGTMKQGGALLIIILLALVSGSLYNRGPMELGLVGNENFYWDTALGLQSADSPAPNLSGVESVIYPHFLSLIAGDEAGAIKKARVLQSRLLLSLLGALVFFLLRTKLSPAPALAGSLAAVFSAPAVVSAGNLDPSAITAVLAMVGLLLISLRNTLPFWILGGIFLGLSALSFPAWGWAALV